jgi:PAS domain S-box-containing protein
VKKDGELDYVIANWTDITESREARALYTTISGSAPTGIYIYQANRFRFVNPHFQRMTGYTEQELQGMTSAELIHPMMSCLSRNIPSLC